MPIAAFMAIASPSGPPRHGCIALPTLSRGSQALIREKHPRPHGFSLIHVLGSRWVDSSSWCARPEPGSGSDLDGWLEDRLELLELAANAPADLVAELKHAGV